MNSINTKHCSGNNTNNNIKLIKRKVSTKLMVSRWYLLFNIEFILNYPEITTITTFRNINRMGRNNRSNAMLKMSIYRQHCPF